jgi:hypothetical protein
MTTPYTVYHALDPVQMLRPGVAQWQDDRAICYQRVAVIDLTLAPGENPHATAVFNQVFTLTNHREHDWTEHPEVSWSAHDVPVRSTSVGDVMVCLDQAWMVMPSGFTLLEAEGGRYMPTIIISCDLKTPAGTICYECAAPAVVQCSCCDHCMCLRHAVFFQGVAARSNSIHDYVECRDCDGDEVEEENDA